MSEDVASEKHKIEYHGNLNGHIEEKDVTKEEKSPEEISDKENTSDDKKSVEDDSKKNPETDSPEDSSEENDEKTSLVRDIANDNNVNIKKIKETLKEYDVVFGKMKENITAINERITGLESMKDSVIVRSDMTTYEKKMSKMDTRLFQLEDEIGVGETLNVSKVPPYILNTVYNANLKDIISEIKHRWGPYDLENILQKVLEDIRTKTSGSELFTYSPGEGIRTRNVVRALESKLITAKQLHATYTELVESLMNYIPGYKPRNFRAVIKIKSQEYAIGMVTELKERYDGMEENISIIENDLKILTNKIRDVENYVSDERKMLWDEINNIKSKNKEKINIIHKERKNNREMVKKISEEADESRNKLMEEIGSIVREFIVDEKERLRREEINKNVDDVGKKVLSMLKDGTSLTVKQILGKENLERDLVEKAIDKLLVSGTIEEKSYGRYVKYKLKEVEE